MNELVILVPLVLVASVLSISASWRVALASLWGVHLLVGLWLLLVVTPEVAVAKAITGTTVCAVLWPGLRTLFAGAAAPRHARRAIDAAGARSPDEPFMLLGALLAAAAANCLSQRFPP